ncbi:DKK3 [Branchiostoma lanceolatum]|uniref:DKK3 protein n=1 Tax=Branchiostoma lanceolatum TaxID=7740 RepID=A0A8K0EJW7_BRALA|nr:DKK3 [Branchiostoma lanceolatum]
MSSVAALVAVVLLAQLLSPTFALCIYRHRQDHLRKIFQHFKKDLQTSVKDRLSDPDAKFLATKERSTSSGGHGLFTKRVKRDLHNDVNDRPTKSSFAEFLERKTKERNFPGLVDNGVRTIVEAEEELLEAAQKMMEDGDFEAVEKKTIEEEVGNGEKVTVHEEVLKNNKTGISVVIGKISANGEEHENLDSDEEEFEWSNIARSHFDDKACMHDEDCDDDKVCFDSLFGGLCGDPFGEGESCTRDRMCRRPALCIMGRCQTGAVPGQEGSVCEVTEDCQEGLCCGYVDGDEFCDVTIAVCRPFLQGGEPCHGNRVSLLNLLGCDVCPCNTGLRCGKDESGSRVCITDDGEDDGSVEDILDAIEHVDKLYKEEDTAEYTLKDGDIEQLSEVVKELNLLGITDTTKDGNDDNLNTPKFLAGIKELIMKKISPP